MLRTYKLVVGVAKNKTSSGYRDHRERIKIIDRKCAHQLIFVVKNVITDKKYAVMIYIFMDYSSFIKYLIILKMNTNI
jgi:hypothetical protein